MAYIAVINLVHGTFDNNAQWTRAESEMCRAINQRLGEKSVLIERFLWSGENSLSAREVATTKLRGQLRVSIEAFPKASHFMIGHSHGGNICLATLSDCPDLAEKVAGVICIGTPFLTVTARDMEATAKALPTLVLSVMLFAAIVVYAAVFVFSVTLALALFAAALIATAAGYLSIVRRASEIGRMLQCIQEQEIAKNPPPQFFGTPLLCVATIADEARGLLGSGWRVADLPFLLWWPSYLNLIWWPLLLIAGSMEVWEYLTSEHHFTPFVVPAVFGATFGIPMAFAMPSFAALLLLYSFSKLVIRITGVPNGLSGASLISNLLVSIRVTARPRDLYHDFFSMVVVGSGISGRWRHSRLCYSDRVIDRIVSWMDGGHLSRAGWLERHRAERKLGSIYKL